MFDTRESQTRKGIESEKLSTPAGEQHRRLSLSLSLTLSVILDVRTGGSHFCHCRRTSLAVVRLLQIYLLEGRHEDYAHLPSASPALSSASYLFGTRFQPPSSPRRIEKRPLPALNPSSSSRLTKSEVSEELLQHGRRSKSVCS